MIVRHVIGAAWALIIGLAGGWLMLSPWALGVQTGKTWTNITKTEFGTGGFLVILALVVLVILVSRVMASFRTVGLIVPRPKAEAEPEPEAAPAAAASPDVDVDGLLGVLAKVLADELSRKDEGGQQQQQRPVSQVSDSWRQQQ
jgi:Na+-transporting methylmalonyl-CoA/oxaloacetate decarboxylase gamma subunit